MKYILKNSALIPMSFICSIDKTEKCIICHRETNVPKNLLIQKRKFYIEGAGQLCEYCFNKIYQE